jgi:hypothetical protein
MWTSTALRNLHFAYTAEVPNDKVLKWSYSTWSDSDMDHTEI